VSSGPRIPFLHMALGAFHRRALLLYRAELTEIISAISDEAKLAGYDPSDYLPGELTTEHSATKQALVVIQHAQPTGPEDFREQTVNLGLNGPSAMAMAAAIAIMREELESRLQAIEAHPLRVEGAAVPLRRRLGILQLEFEHTWSKVPPSPMLEQVRERRLRKRGLIYPRRIALDVALQIGEGQEIDFKERIPEQAHKLAKEFAGFGTSNPGTIFVGIANDGTVVGIDGIGDLEGKDRFRQRIEGLTSATVKPPLVVRVDFEMYESKLVARIEVPKGSQAVYFANDIPYIRHISSARPATPQEVTELVQRWSERMATSEEHLLQRLERLDGEFTMAQVIGTSVPITWGT
jgi:Putative DNA-binding domain